MSLRPAPCDPALPPALGTAIDRRALMIAIGASAIGAAVGASTIAGAAVAAAARYDDPDDIYAALRDQPAIVLDRGGRTVSIVFADGAPGLDRARTIAWINRAMTALMGYFGQLPVAQYGLLVIAEPGDGVGHATTFGYGGAITRIRVGTGATDAAFARDWVLVHEMLHTALPDLPRRSLWLQEGNATWVEPVARVAAGQLPASEVWRQAIIGMPRGEPGPGAGAIDGTMDHGRLYWGGATFWLLAEIAIIEQSRGRHGLRDAMRAINRASGGNIVDWTPEAMMAVGDRAINAAVLTDLYARFVAGPVSTDLDGLFARLGVAASGGGVVFNDAAPLAAIRRRITAPNPDNR